MWRFSLRVFKQLYSKYDESLRNRQIPCDVNGCDYLRVAVRGRQKKVASCILKNQVGFWVRVNTTWINKNSHESNKGIQSRTPPSKNFVFFDLNESPLKMMKNNFHFMSKALFVLEIFTFLSRLFDYVENRLAMVNFKDWTTNNYNIHIAQYLKK